MKSRLDSEDCAAIFHGPQFDARRGRKPLAAALSS